MDGVVVMMAVVMVIRVEFRPKVVPAVVFVVVAQSPVVAVLVVMAAVAVSRVGRGAACTVRVIIVQDAFAVLLTPVNLGRRGQTAGQRRILGTQLHLLADVVCRCSRWRCVDGVLPFVGEGVVDKGVVVAVQVVQVWRGVTQLLFCGVKRV